MREFEAFPSPTFKTEVHSAAERIDKIRADLESLQEYLLKQRRNREALDLAGKDYVAEISKTVVKIAEVERELDRARDSMHLLFSAERERHAVERQKLWELVYFELIQAANVQFASLVSTLRKMSEQLVGLKSEPVAGTVSSSTLDAGVAVLNALVAEYKLPSNLLIGHGSSLSFSFRHAIREMLKTTDLDAALKELRQHLESLDTNKPVSQFDPAFASAPGSRKLWAGR